MCPFIWLTLILSWLVAMLEIAAGLTVTFQPRLVSMREMDTQQVNFSVLDHSPPSASDHYVEYDIQVGDDKIAGVVGTKSFIVRNDHYEGTRGGPFNDTFTLKGLFLGQSEVFIVRREKANSGPDVISGKNDREGEKSNSADVIIKRKSSLISTIFIISVASLVSINYINMGCALDISVVKSVLRKPIAPAVGFLSQYIVMPIISYFVGSWLFGTEKNYLWLGLFIFGCSPAGGASNMWTVLLKGNLDLSITMTFISTVAAIGMLPFWMYTLGKHIFEGTTTRVPFSSILGTLVSMGVFLGIGLLVQKYLPNVAKVCKRILAPFSICMIIFIITFGTYANLYMFKLMSFKILLAAAITVWCGFFVGFVVSSALKLPLADRIAISIETGIQNTGIAIVLLGFSLSEPSNDIASVVPVAASIVTPIPLTLVMIFIKLRSWWSRRQDMNLKTGASTDFDQIKSVSNSSSSTLLAHGINSVGSTPPNSA